MTTSGLLSVYPFHAVGARLSVPVSIPIRNQTNDQFMRPRSASLRSVVSSGPSGILFDEEKKCIICPLKEAIRQQPLSNKDIRLPSSSFTANEQQINFVSSNNFRQSIANQPIYRSYKQRWMVLSTVCLLALSNATQWISFAPLHEAANTFYCFEDSIDQPSLEILAQQNTTTIVLLDSRNSRNCDVVLWTSQIFQLVGVLTGLFGMYITDRYGIRISCHLGSALNLCGAIIRVLSVLPQMNKIHRLSVLYLGQTIAATSQPFFLCLSPKIAEYWFEEDQRALANSLSFIANPFGVFLGSIAPVVFSSITEQLDVQIFYLNVSLLGLASLVMLSCLFVTRSKPPTPPSASSQCEHKPGFSEGLCVLLRSPVFCIQTLTFGLAFALQWSIFVSADKQLIGLGHESKVTGYLLSLSALSGTAASILAGWIVDRTKKFNEFIKGSYIGVALSAVALDVFLHFRHQSDLDTAILVLLFTLLGFFAIPVFPISLELGVESTFPVAEATSSGILIIAGQLQLFLLTFGMQSLESVGWIYNEERNYKLAIDFWAVCAIFAMVFSCIFLCPRYYRLEYEQNAVFLNLLPPRFDEMGNVKTEENSTITETRRIRNRRGRAD